MKLFVSRRSSAEIRRLEAEGLSVGGREHRQPMVASDLSDSRENLNC